MKAILASSTYLMDAPPEMIKRVKDELTLDNPAYHSAKKHSKWANVRIPMYLTFYEARNNQMKVPAGYKFPSEFTTIEDHREEVTVPYPRFLLKLRPHQEQALKAYLNNTDAGLISLPTGKGKSILGLALASRLKQKTLVIVHKDDLVVGWSKDIQLVFGSKLSHGLIKAKSRTIGEQITIATIQTLNNLSEDDFDDLENEFGMIIVDECHHTPSSSYAVLNNFSAPYKIGLSATPERNDGLTKVMHFHLGDFCYIYSLEKGEKEIDILPVDVIVRESPLKYTPMCTEVREKVWKIDPLGDTPIDEIDHKQRPTQPFTEIENLALLDKSFSRIVVSDVLHEYSLGVSCLIFLSQKEHCRHYYDLLKEVIPKDEIVLYYGDSTESNADILASIESGKYRVTISTYKKATEGTNVKIWGSSFLVSSVNNGLNVEQATGRIRRLHPDKPTTARQYDYRHPNVYGLSRHGYTRDARYKKMGLKVIHAHPVHARPVLGRGYSRLFDRK